MSLPRPRDVSLTADRLDNVTQSPPWPAGPPPQPGQQQPVPYGAQPYGSLSGPYQPRRIGEESVPAQSYQPPPPEVAPIGVKPPQSVHIEQFEPPKALKGIVGALVIALLLVGAGFFLTTKPHEHPTSTPTPTPTPTPTTSYDPNANAIDFDADGITGRWEVIDETWHGNAVTLHLTIEVTKGSLRYGFFAFSNTESAAIYPSAGSGKQPELSSGRITAGNSLDGYVTFLMKTRSGGAIYLTSSNTKSLSALRIKG